jgi:hypothetical protein
VSGPALRDKSGRFYTHPKTGQRLEGVSGLASLSDDGTNALMAWATNLTAEAAVDTREAWDPLTLKVDAVDLIKGRSRKAQTYQRDVGTEVHDYLESLTKILVAGGKMPEHKPSILPYVRAWEEWLEEYRPTFLETETTVANLTLGYAGTFDALCEVPGHGLTLVDYKTGKRIRTSNGIQQVAYNRAEVILREDGTEEPWPGADVLWLVQIRPGGYSVHRVEDPDWALTYLDAAVQIVKARALAGGLVSEVPAPLQVLA